MERRDCDARCTVPCRPPAHTVRPALVAWLKQAAHKRLVVLTAPAGSGKTALLATFAADVPLPVVWYSFDRRDRDSRTMLHGLLRACRQSLPNAFATTAVLREATTEPSLPTLNSALLCAFAHVPRDTVLILDNWHLVDSVRSCRRIIEDVLAHCPRLHIILATRTLPSLQHMLMLASIGQLCGIDADGLRTGAAPTLPHARSTDQPARAWSGRHDDIDHLAPGVDVAA